MKTKIFTLFLALVACVGSMFAAWGNYMVLIGDFYYIFDEANRFAQVWRPGPTLQYDHITTAVVPETVEYNSVTYTVTRINSCQSLSYLKKISFPNTITEIATQAFFQCVSLDSIVIPSSVKSMGENVFNGCTGLKMVTIHSDSVLAQPDLRTIFGTQVQEYVIGDDATAIGANAFARATDLQRVALGNSVASIGASAFNQCPNISSITIPQSVVFIGERAFQSCSNLHYITFLGCSAHVESGAFWGTALASGGAVYITDVAAWCGMSFDTPESNPLNYTHALYVNGELVTDLIIPEGVQLIGEYAFYGCNSIRSAHLPSSLAAMSNTSIYSPSLLNIEVDPNNTVFRSEDGVLIEGNTLYQYPSARMAEYQIPTTVTTIFSNAFFGATYVAVICHDNMTGLWSDAFYGANLGYIRFLGTGTATQHMCPAGVTCPIYVPCGALETYRTAWPTLYSSITYAPLRYTLTPSVYPEKAGQLSAVSNECEWPLVATPNYGYHFVRWSDGVTDSERTIDMTQDTAVTAIFEKNTYTIISTSAMPEWGTAHDTIHAAYLDEVEISATANEHYYFANWNDYNTQNPRRITVKGDSVFTAYFNPVKYHVTKQYGTGGEVYGPDEVEYNTWAYLEAVPYHGYHFVQWSDGATDNPRDVLIVQDTVFAAEFALNTFGQCGNNLYWRYEDGRLAITGSGEMYQYTRETIPWIYWKPEIKSVSCSSEMTSLSAYAFSDINTSKFNTIILPTNLVSIGAHAFDGDSFLENVDFGASLESVGEYAFKGCVRVLNMTNWAEFTPNVGYKALDDISSSAELSVLGTALRKFQLDDNWNRFLLKEIGAAETTVTANDVIVLPGDNSAEVTWPVSNNAASYTLEITKDGVAFCTLIFNANGQLTGISFAPSRDGNSQVPAATMTSAGMVFTVTGLDSGTNYNLTLAAKDQADRTITIYTTEFTTTGESAMEGLNQIINDQLPTTHKVFRNGQILILRGDKTFTLTGQEVR